MIANVEQILSRFESQRLLVLGDVMLDRYWVGDASRISPEAPVPIVRWQRSSSCPGGAANVALNASALGAAVTLLGVTGDDIAASELRDALRSRRVSTKYLFAEPGRKTTVKTRVIANKQQVVRMDEEDTHPVSKHQEQEILGTVEALLAFCDCVILSDYAKGFVTSTLATTLLAMARKVSVPVIVDPKGADAIRYRGATVIKPNRSELSLLTGLPVRSHADTLDACEQLSSALPGIVILATEGAGGMTLRLPDGTCIHLPARALEVFDVTGAGDTVIAVAGIAIGSGADFRCAAQIANCAAGIVVGEFGCAEVSLDRLTAEITKPRFNVQTRRDSCQPVVAAASKPAS